VCLVRRIESLHDADIASVTGQSSISLPIDQSRGEVIIDEDLMASRVTRTPQDCAQDQMGVLIADLTCDFAVGSNVGALWNALLQDSTEV